MIDTNQRRWPWSILGIDATTDPAEIKAAYAARLRLTRPDDDPEGFQRLRQARDGAMAKTTDPAPGPAPTAAEENPVSAAPAGAQDPVQPHDAQSGADDTEPSGTSGPDRVGQPQALSERLQSFLASPWAKTDPRRWRQLFEDLPILDAPQRTMLERSLARQFDAWLDSDSLPDPAILMVLNEEFAWDTSNSGLDDILDRPNVARIRTIITSLRG